ncbi:C39 family peptidase [Viridibacillus arvi]|uniref:C39 family peptidase n=1 Tax=Viridibacillus arvi TaxID=263475 RepID=UPI003D2AF2F9
MKKTAVSFLLAIPLLLPSIVGHAAGNGDNPEFTEDVKTPEQLVQLAEKEKALEQWVSGNETEDGIAPYALDEGFYKLLAVPSYKQETSYWCGPATTKQVLSFINGSAGTQTTIAKDLGTTTAGTDFSKIDDYLNDKQNRNTYVYSDGLSYADWTYRLEYGLSKNYPVVLDLKITSSYMPKYTASVEGHILNVSGVDTKTSSSAQVRLTDPFDQGNRGVTLGNVWHPYSGVYNANKAHFRQAILW